MRAYGELQGTPREPRLMPAPVQKNDSVTSTLGGIGWPQPMLYAALGGYASNTGVPVTPFTALQSAAVYSCIRCIAQDIALLRPGVQARLPNGLIRKLPIHPVNLLFSRPNQWMTAYEFWSYMVTSICLRGNAYTVVERDEFGSPVELIPVAPDRVTIMLSDEGELWYRVNSRRLGYGIVIPPEDMLHLKNISLDGYMGVSPIAISQDVIGLALATQQHGGILFRQGGQIGGVIQFPGPLSDLASKRIQNSWMEQHAGVQNAHKVAVLEEGGTYQKIAMTNEDAQFLATRQFQVVDICRIYGVPPHKVGELTRATFANIEQQQQQYIDSALQPLARSIEELCDHHLLFADERLNMGIKFDFDQMTRGDTKTRYETYQIALLNGILSRNEVRAKENLNPVEGGDEYRVPLNTADPTDPQQQPGAAKPPPPPQGGEQGEGDDEEEDENADADT